MKTFESLEDRQISNIDSNNLEQELSKLYRRDPKRALLLSVIPGCGQLYNGEVGKGLVFLAVNLANLIVIAFLFGTEQVLGVVWQLSQLFHTEPKINIQQTLEIIHTGRLVTLVYLGLILSYITYVARDAYDQAKLTHRGHLFHKFFLGLPEATSGSYLFHFASISTLVILMIFVVTPKPPQEQATEIELVQEQAPPPKKIEPPKPKPEPKKEEVKKSEEKPKLKIPQEKPKPTPVAVAVQTDKPVVDNVVQSSEPVPESTPAKEGSANGSPNGTSQQGEDSGGEGAEVDFGSYLAEVQKRIKKNWFPPRGNESKTVTIKFKVRKDGSAHGLKLTASSGIAVVDEAAKTAIKNSSPFPALPPGSPDDIDIKFTFDYNVFNGGKSASDLIP